MDIFYDEVLEEMKQNIKDGNVGGIVYMETWDYEDEYSHNDIARNREEFVYEANKYFKNNDMPYVMKEIYEDAVICDKETGEIIDKPVFKERADRKFTNRYWEVGEKNKFGKECYLLHFTEFENDEVILSFVQDEEDEYSYVYTSELLNTEYDFIEADSIEEAREIFEDMIVEYLEEQISCIEETIKNFNELN